MAARKCAHAWLVSEWERTDKGFRATQLLCPKCGEKKPAAAPKIVAEAVAPEMRELPIMDGPPIK
jgi:hypothetical protein